MSWFKAAGNYASGAIKAAATAVAPQTQRSPRELLKDHVAYVRSFYDATQQDSSAKDWDKLALTYRVPEELDAMLQLLEAENPYASAMREDPSKGQCTMHFLEENVMDMFYGLMGLDHSVNLQRWVIKAVIRALRLRYELLDNGSIARIVLKMAERLEYSAKRFQFAIVHCEFLYTLCDKVHRNPSSLLPVIISEEVNKSGLGKELLLLNWTVQHLQDPAGGEYAQRGVLLLLRIGDERVTLAASDHSSLIERTVRMVDTGFKNGMQVIDKAEGAMDEVGAVRGRPDPAQFYASLRFVDHVVRVADIRIARQLIGKLDRQFMRQTLARKLLRGSEVQHVAVMEMMRGLFEADAVSVAQGTFTRRIQQPQLASMLTRFICGLPAVEGGEDGDEGEEQGCEITETLVERMRSIDEDESVAALQLFSVVVEMHDKQAIHALIASPLTTSANSLHLIEAVDSCSAQGGGGQGVFDDMQQRISVMLQSLAAASGGAWDEWGGAESGLEAYKRDAMRNVSTCFRCCELWVSDYQCEDAPVRAPGDGKAPRPSFLDVLMGLLSTLFTNSFRVNTLVTGIFSRLSGYPDALQHAFFLNPKVSDALPPSTTTLIRCLEKLCADAAMRLPKLSRAAARLKQARASLAAGGGSLGTYGAMDDAEERRTACFVQGVIVLREFLHELQAVVVAKRQCCQAWGLLGVPPPC